MIEKLEIHHLRTLDALYEYKNLTVAAEKLNITQQAISLQLKKIRNIMSDDLFTRSGHGVHPTPYAKFIEPNIKAVLSTISKIPLPDSITPFSIERTIVISATDYTQQVILKDLISKLIKLSPSVKLIVVPIESANLSNLMRKGEIDLAFTSSGYVPPGLHEECLFTEQYRFVSANRKLISEYPLTLKQISNYKFVVTNPGVGCLRGSADTWFERNGFPRNVVLSAPTFQITQTYLSDENLVGFLPSRLLPIPGLHDIAIEKYPPGYQVVMAYHPSLKDDIYIDWLKNLVKEICSNKR